MAQLAPDFDLESLLLTRRLERFANGSAVAALPSLATIVLLASIYARHLATPLALSWAGAFLAILAARVALARGLARPGIATALPLLRKRYRDVQLVLGAGSLAWALSLPLAGWLDHGREGGAFALIGTIVFVSVMFMHQTLPVVARFHVVAVGLGLGLGLVFNAGSPPSLPPLLLIAMTGAALLVAIGRQEARFQAACRQEYLRADSERLVTMLLDDHESQVAEWLWAIDADGRLVDTSDRLVTASGRDRAQLEDTTLLALLEPGRERNRIAHALEARTSFTDEPAVIDRDGQRREWRLSGHPRPDGGFAGAGRDVTDRLGMAERIRAMAQSDPLTGLANRHAFKQAVEALLTGDGAGVQRPVALFHLDLDDFKSVNDMRGPAFGDSVLREIGLRLKREARPGDLVARLGADEFAVALQAPGGDGLLIERAHRLLAAIREPLRLDGWSATITASVGVARAGTGGDAGELMRRSALALLAAKTKGRDRMALFDPSLDRVARERRALEHELREALDGGGLVLHYQPLVSLASGATTGYEALLRWNHPTRGLLQPDQFLSIAEDTGLIVPLGDWVLRTALAEVSEWEGDFRLALNVSPSQIRNPRFVATVERLLSMTGFPAARLEFEITEHVLIGDAEAGAAMLQRLRALGAEIALDDFGTGYSSLSYLRSFRFDRIKVDRSFVRDIETSDEARAIVSATTRLAEALGIKTTAEGVERAGQLDLLRKLGCTEAQGFYILEPVEARRIAEARGAGEDFPGAGSMAGARSRQTSPLPRPRSAPRRA